LAYFTFESHSCGGAGVPSVRTATAEPFLTEGHRSLHRQLRLLMAALFANLTSGLMTKAIVSGVNNDIISDFKEIRDGLQAIRGLQVELQIKVALNWGRKNIHVYI
jgi:hypothetical protein